MVKVGKWAFILGLAIAVVAGLGVEQTWFPWGLALLGLLVGILNISGAETHGFLLAAIGLMLSVTAVQDLPFVGEAATWILANVAAFIAPAVVVVALKTLLHMAKTA